LGAFSFETLNINFPQYLKLRIAYLSLHHLQSCEISLHQLSQLSQTSRRLSWFKKWSIDF
jgi:hypothetical protein